MSISKKFSFSAFNKAFASLAVWCYRNRWGVLLFCVLVLGGVSYLANKVTMDNSFESFFDESDPTYSAYKVYRKNFGSDEITYIMYDASKYSHGIFNKTLIEKIHLLTQQLDQKVPFVGRVRSITNAELMTGEGDDLVIKTIDDEWPVSQQRLLEFAQQFKKKPIFVGNLFDRDMKYGAIVVEMTRSSTDPIASIRLDPKGGDSLGNMYPQVSNKAIKKILKEPQFSSIPFYLSGDVPLNATYNQIVDRETTELGGITAFVIIIILAVFFRGKIVGVLGPLTVVGLATLMTMAFIAAMHWHIDMMFAMAPTLLLAMGVADGVHIVSEFMVHARETGDRETALYKTMYLVGTPCLLTSLTTAAGFVSMAIAPIKTISHMAIYMSVGVMCAFILSMTLLTFFLAFVRIPKQAEAGASELTRLERLLRVCSGFTIKNPRSIFTVFLLMVLVAGAGLAFLKIDSNYLLDFSNRVQVKRDTQFIDKTIGGMSPFAYLFETGQQGGIKDPAFLHELDRFQHEVNSHFPLIRKSTSIVDMIKDINQSFHGDDPAYYKIPDSRALISQYLLVYELSGGKDLYTYVTRDYSQAILQMRVKLTNSSVLAKFDKEMRAYVAAHPLNKTEISSTGIGALWLKLINYISDSQIQGLSIALVVITLLISLIFGSFKLGVVSMIPNIGPILIVGGLMGWMGVYLDYSKLLIAPIAIGIAVDDTIHLITRFRLEFERLGNYRAAFEATIHEVGRALVITSVTLVCGFSALFLSVMTAQVWFGVLLSLTILLALLADIFITPVLVFWLKPFGEERCAYQPR